MRLGIWRGDWKTTAKSPEWKEYKSKTAADNLEANRLRMQALSDETQKFCETFKPYILDLTDTLHIKEGRCPTLKEIVNFLNSLNLKTQAGNNWTLQSVYKMTVRLNLATSKQLTGNKRYRNRKKP